MRAFGADALPCHLLDEILSYSAGRVRIESDSERRYYPSAGGRYPIELYFVSNNVDSLEPGLYHYSAKDNSLEVLWHKDLSTDCARIFGADFDSTVVNYVVLTGVMSRAEVKYGINAYRFALIECGHLCQNICLLATERDVSHCPIGGFDNRYLEQLLDTGEDEVPLYAMAIGSRTSM